MSIHTLFFEVSSSVTTSLSSTWTNQSPKFRRYRSSSPGFYYQVFGVTVPVTGLYSLASISNIDTFGYLYKDRFTVSSVKSNLVSFDDQSGGNNQFRMTLTLKANVAYDLVATTFRPYQVGEFQVAVRGPARAILTAIGV